MKRRASVPKVPAAPPPAAEAGGSRFPMTAEEEERLRDEIVERLLDMRRRRCKDMPGRCQHAKCRRGNACAFGRGR
jgi:hypothetical protein